MIIYSSQIENFSIIKLAVFDLVIRLRKFGEFFSDHFDSKFSLRWSPVLVEVPVGQEVFHFPVLFETRRQPSRGQTHMESSDVVTEECDKSGGCDEFTFFVTVRSLSSVVCPGSACFPVETFVVGGVHVGKTRPDTVLTPGAFFDEPGHCLDMLFALVVSVDVAPGRSLDPCCAVLVTCHHHSKIIVAYERYRAV